MRRFLMMGWMLAWGGVGALAGDKLYQVSTIDALLAGVYDGAVSVGTLKRFGDFGIGTFDHLDGEMLVLDGVVYRVSSDGRATLVADAETTPFASVTDFDPELLLPLSRGLDFEHLKQTIAGALPSENLFYAIRLKGTFLMVSTRSVPRQIPPYEPLVEVVKTQPVFEFKKVEGVVVGFWCPSFVKGINVPGFHLHFLTQDCRSGGHILALETDCVTLEVDTLHRFEMQLPDHGEFAAVDLLKDRKLELKKVER